VGPSPRGDTLFDLRHTTGRQLLTPSSVTSTRDPERLFRLLPAIYRTRDAALGGPLRALLDVLSQQVERVERDIARMYDNWFIETCEDWVVPYLGELVGYAPVADAGLQTEPLSEEAALRNRFLAPRREVAETVALRRRRGTLAVLELLANDGAGWPARAVELFRGVVVAQHVNFARHRRGVTLVRNAVISWNVSPVARDSSGVRSRRGKTSGVSQPAQTLSRGNRARSATMTSHPARRSRRAAVEPAGPPPTINASQ